MDRVMDNSGAERAIEVVHLPGPVPYRDALHTQVTRRKAVEANAGPNTLFTLEHTPVITCGRHTKQEHLLYPEEAYSKAGIEVIEVDRGGDVTYHGPGQLTAYPILNLAHWTQSVNWYLRQLEEIIVQTLGEFGIDAGRLEGYTGVWTEKGKIAQIGIGVRRWVTYHGVAINVEPNLEHFAMIVPCGIPDKPVTTIQAHLDDPVSVEQVGAAFSQRLVDHFREA